MARCVALIGFGMALAIATVGEGCRTAGDTANMAEVQRLKSGALNVVVLSPHQALRHGKDSFTVEFRSASDGSLVDVGNVLASANMPMPGMPMFGSFAVQRTTTPGRYAVTSDLGMAGSWRMKIEWDGPKDPGSVSFTGSVQ